MAVTLTNVIDRARVPLNDDAKVRHTDAQMLVYAKDGLRLLRAKRPDLFFSDLDVDIEALAGASAFVTHFPLAEDYAPALQDYVTARAETRNNETELEARAVAFFNLFKAEAFD
jgi:hypothetical protein